MDAPKEGRCNARLRKKPGQYCGRAPLKGRTRCRLHGGASLSGPANGNWKGGRWSKAMGRFREAYDNAEADEALLDVRRTLAILDVAVQRSAARVNELDTPAFRQRALQLYRESRDLVASGEPEQASRKLGELGQLLGRGVSEDVAFAHLVGAADTMAKRLEAAWGLKLRGQQVATRSEVVATLSKMIDIVIRLAPREVASRIVETTRLELFGREGDEPEALPQGGDYDGSDDDVMAP